MLQTANRQIQFQCPHCGSRNPAVVWTRIDADDAERVKGILDGTLFESTCRGCDTPVHADHSIDFHDGTRNLFVRYEAAGDVQPAGSWTAALSESESVVDYRLIRAESQHSFIELVHIWRDRMDPARMLLVKFLLLTQIWGNSKIHPVVFNYDRRTPEGDLEYVMIPEENSEPDTVIASYEAYEEFGPLLEPALPDLYAPNQWLLWNSQTAERLWKYVHTA